MQGRFTEEQRRILWITQTHLIGLRLLTMRDGPTQNRLRRNMNCQASTWKIILASPLLVFLYQPVVQVAEFQKVRHRGLMER